MTETLVAPSAIEQGLLSGCLSRGADYEVYTGSMQSDDNAEEGRYVVSMIGSSTVRDLQGDIMLLSALDDMTKIPDNLTCYTNHKYDIPDDVYGGLYGRPWIKSSNGIADLHLKVETEASNPKAMQVYNMISKSKRRLGCSIGCQVTDYEYDQDTNALIIKSVTVLEYSLVSIPANQRCWVEVATKSLFERSLLEGRGDDALQLAPAVKGMYSHAFGNIVKHIESRGLRQDLERITPRGTAPHRVMTAFNDGEIYFALAEERKGITKSLSRDEVSALLKAPIVDVTKDVSGKTSLPLMDIDTEWTGAKAEKQIFEYAKDDNGAIVASKAKQCFLSCDPENSDKQSGYKMPFTYIVDGSPKIVPLGVRAAAGVLSGGMGGVSASADDKDGMKAKCKTMYGRINSQFSPDPAWIVPWEKDESKSVKDLLGTGNGGELIRQDLTEQENEMEEKEKSVEVASDGTHAAMTGVHTHSHPAFGAQGDDATHEHSHSHDNDASHHHSHAEKSAEVETTKDSEPEVVKEQEVEEVEDVNEETTATPDATPEVTKSVDAIADASVEVVKETEPAQTQEVDPERLGLLSAYNMLGKQLGFEVATLEAKKGIGNPDDLQELITCISQADQCIDRAMVLIGIPDADGVSSPLGMYSLDVQFQKALTDALTLKSGAAISAANKDIIKAMHDHSKASHDLAATLHPDCCKCEGMGNQGTDFDNARQDAEFQMGNENGGNGSKAYEPLVEAMSSLSDALKSLDMPSITNQVNSAQTALETIKKQLSMKSQELNTLTHTMNVLKNAPLGRPTQLNRATVPGEATYADMKVAGGQTLSREDIVGMTSVHQTSFGMQRHWPASVGSEHRPALTLDQKSLMHPYSVMAYQDGHEADVPMIDDPFSN